MFFGTAVQAQLPSTPDGGTYQNKNSQNNVGIQDKLEQQLITETRQVAQQFDFENAGFDFLDSLVEEKNIVLLGEAGHGDGKTFLLKKDIIAYLNQKHGFNTLVME